MGRRLTCLTPVGVMVAAGLCATVPASAGAVRDGVTERLAQRLFPLFDRMQPNDAMVAVLDARRGRKAACGDDLVCGAQAMMWTQAEMTAMADRVPPHGPLPDDSAAAQARREMEGVNAILRTYALGQVPPYAQIDGAGTIDPLERQARLQAAEWIARTPGQGTPPAIDLSFAYALALLDVSDRTDAIGFEPLNAGANAAAMQRARKMEWQRYRYTALIVTGVGPEVADMAISPYGKYHLRLAANRFARGEAPFIIVTGGRAHPRATRFTEAQEMRDALIERYGVPADAILIEPYARHTTTNLRNASRLLMAMGAPMNRDALIVCNPGQSAAIGSAQFVKRNEAELGYQPGILGRRLSPTELEFRPVATSARVDPRDPLDP